MLIIDKVTFYQDAHPILSDLSLSLARGEIGVVMGKSGAGKTSLLQAIAGFHAIKQGAICFDDHVLSTMGYTLPPEKRRIGMVFQDYALFPHLKTRANVLFGIKNLNSQQKKRSLEEVTALTQIEAFLDKYPNELSGGEQQRVALARTLITKMKLMLFDEPFSHLDADLTRSLSFGVRSFLKEHMITALVVSHDKIAGINICDKLGTLYEGVMSEWLNRRDIEPDPAEVFRSLSS